MSTRERHFKLINNDTEGAGGTENIAGGRMLTMIILLAAVLSVAAHWATSDQSAAAIGPEVQMQQEIEPAVGFEYFPAQYTNQATTIEEHIQAF